MSYNPFHKLIRFRGTKADFDAVKVSGSLIFAEITNAEVKDNIAPYYIYANDTEFAFNSFSEFTSAITNITGDEYIIVATPDENDRQSVNISHKTSDVTAGDYGSKTSDLVFSIPKFTVDAKGHVTAAENLDISIDVSTAGHNTVEGSEFITVEGTVEGDHTKYTVSAKTTALGDAVGMVYDEVTGTWSAADGSVTNGLATAADVAYEIVADERVIAAALNNHKSLIKDLETTVTDITNDITVNEQVIAEALSDHELRIKYLESMDWGVIS